MDSNELARIADKMNLIQAEIDDLTEAVIRHLDAREKDNRKPQQGDGAKWETDQYGWRHCVAEGFPQGATATAIERKIITIREHLNVLRKLVC